MTKKILLIGGGVLLLLVALFVFVLVPGVKVNTSFDAEETAFEKAVNTIAYSMVSELKSEADYKQVWEDAAKNMLDEESFEIIMEMGEMNEEGTMVMKVDGDDMGVYADYSEEGVEFEMTIVKKDGYVYFGIGDEGIKIKEDADAAKELQSEFDVDEFKKELTEADWDEDEVEYKGLETLGTRKYHKFYSEKDEVNMWIDALSNLPAKAEFDRGYITAIISYGSVTIEVPEDYEDISNLSEEEQEEKMMEVFFGAMFGDMDWDDDDWDMDWDDDDDWDFDWDDDDDWDMDWDDDDLDFDWDDEELE